MLTRFHLSQFRNYTDQEFRLAERLSIICGINGSGKTSLLEGLYVLATGRSFRTSKLANVVSAEAETCTLFAEIIDGQRAQRIGVSRDRKGLVDARIDGQRIQGLSQLAHLLPVQALHPGTVQLIEGGPGDRRRYMDWLLFHVEPEFPDLWQRLREAVSQRNRLLKLGQIKDQELTVWDQQVASNSARIDDLRREHLPGLEASFSSLLAGYDSSLGKVALSLYSGWPEGVPIEQSLRDHKEQDCRRGFTSVGAHRADLVLRSGKGQAKEVFSRGQQKVVAYALVMAQIERLNTLAERRCLVLVDDITSELDQGNEAKVLDSVLSTGNQAVVTTLDERIARPYSADQDTAVFHVEHGVLQPMQ